MTKYTAADFANARFAEHPDGRTARRIEAERGTVFAWSMEHKDGEEDYCADEHLAAHGWVPVPTKPEMTESRVKKMVGDWAVNEFAAGFALGFRQAGGQIIPDPEPTNTDRLEELIISAPGNFEGVKAILKRPANVRAWAEHLNDHGVTAPNAKGN